MEWKELNKIESQSYYENVILLKDNIEYDCDPQYADLRKNIVIAFEDTLRTLNIKKSDLLDTSEKYNFDVQFGVRLYDIFRNGKYEMGERNASNDDIWRYIQVKVVPSIVISRWGIGKIARLYNQSNRLYLKTLWWYVHLSYNNDIKTTLELLSSHYNSSDTIVQLTERSGKTGYRLDLYRSIMYLKEKYKVGGKEFRKLMVLNSARLKTVNPILTANGIEGYVEKLIKDIRGTKNETGNDK